MTGAILRHDHTLCTGDTLRLRFRLVRLDGTPYDLDGVTGVCQVRAEPGGELLLEPDVVIEDAADGLFQLVANAEDTASLSAGRAHYAARLTLAGDERTVVAGRLILLASVVEASGG